MGQTTQQNAAIHKQNKEPPPNNRKPALSLNYEWTLRSVGALTTIAVHKAYASFKGQTAQQTAATHKQNKEPPPNNRKPALSLNYEWTLRSVGALTTIAVHQAYDIIKVRS